MLTFLKNWTIYLNRYKTHPQAVVIACYFNPQNSPYRLKAFRRFHRSIRHLDHRIVECLIGDAAPQLPDSPFITRVQTASLLWHKESLLNGLIRRLPPKYRYVFWLDADVLFENKNWLRQGVRQLQRHTLIQPFEYCVHLEKDQTRCPWPPAEAQRRVQSCIEKGLDPGPVRVWRSFCANHAAGLSAHPHYDLHGHVGFAWGARRRVLEKTPLYDHALIGGADHVMAHAGAGHRGHPCISKSFGENLQEVNEWSARFHDQVQGNLGFVRGNLLHLWHGDVAKRQYLDRIRAFAPQAKKITAKDRNGLYITQDDSYMRQYFASREVPPAGFPAADHDMAGDAPGWGGPNRDQAGEALISGGAFGGAGAGGSWEPARPESDPPPETAGTNHPAPPADVPPATTGSPPAPEPAAMQGWLAAHVSDGAWPVGGFPESSNFS